MGAVPKISRVLAALAAAAIALIVGFAAMSTHDTQSMASIRSAITVTEIHGNAPVYPALKAEARKFKANFYQIRLNPTGKTQKRFVAPVVGDRGLHNRTFPDGNYDAFDRSLRTQIVSLDVSSEYGSYLSTLPVAQLRGVADDLNAAGVGAQVESLDWLGAVRYMTSYTPIISAVGAALCAALLAGFVFTASRTRQHALARTMGVRSPYARDLLVASVVLISAFAVLAGIAAVILNEYNNGAQLDSYLGVSLTTFATLLGAGLVGSMAVAVLPNKLRFAAAHSRWQPWGRGKIVLFVTQAATLTLLSMLILQAATAFGSLVTLQEHQKDWASCRGCAVTILNNYRGPSGLDEAVAPYASAVKELSRSRGTVMSWTPGSHQGSQYTPGDPASNVLIVNPEYLRLTSARTNNFPSLKLNASGWGIILPATHKAEAASISAQWKSWFSVKSEPVVGAYRPQRIFNFGETDFRDDSISDSPAIIVVAPGSDVLDAESYFAAGSSGSLFMRGSSAAVEKAFNAAGLPRAAYALDSLNDQVARGVSLARERALIALIASIVGTLALLAAIVVWGRAQRALYAHEVLAYVTHGRFAWATYLRLSGNLVTVGAVSAALLAITVRSGITSLDPTNAVLWQVFGALSLLWLLFGLVATRSARIAKDARFDSE